MISVLSRTLPVRNTAEHTAPEQPAFFPALDGLRAVAFLLVFLQHYYALPWGWAGVNIFFVLSGFLITGILFDTRDQPHRSRNFYIRRTLRIFPLYYGIFLILLLLYPIVHWRWTAAWLAWPLYMGNFLRFLSPASRTVGTPLQLASEAWLSTRFHPNAYLYFGHFWSLCVEEQFYLVWPWVVFWQRSRRALLWVCGSTVIAVPLLRGLAQHTLPPWILAAGVLNRATPFQLDALLLGGLIALLWRGGIIYRRRLLGIAPIVALAAAVATLLYLAFNIHPSALPSWRDAYRYPPWRLTWGLTFINVFAAAVILCCLRRSGWLVHFLSLRPLRWLGRISYGAYVFHEIFHSFCIYAALKLVQHFHVTAIDWRLISMLIALSSTVTLAWLSFRFFESPFLNLKDRWTRRA